jgi:hypothetical protein
MTSPSGSSLSLWEVVGENEGTTSPSGSSLSLWVEVGEN